MAPALPGKKERLTGIDSMRFVAAAIVVIGHSYRTDGPSFVFINNALRFVVPFFFATSGYMLTAKLLENDKASVYLGYAKRLFLLYVAWSLIYFLNPPFHDISEMGLIGAYSHRLQEFLSAGPEEVIFEGISFHFWFFMSMILTSFYFLLFRVRNIGWMVVASAALYAFGLAAKAYANSPIGIHVPINTRDYIFFSALPFSLGAYLRRTDLRVSDATALGLLFGGMALSLMESWFLRIHYAAPVKLDFNISTIIMGTGAFLVAKNGIGILGNSRLASFGKLSFGIYAVHILVAERIVSYSRNPALAEYWYLIEAPVVLTLAILLTYGLRRIPSLRILM